MSFLDKRLKKTIIKNKGFGMIATNNIKKGEIIIRDTPFTIRSNKIYSEIFQLIYEALNDPDISSKFMKLQPKSLENYNINKDRIKNELEIVKNYNADMYNYFINNYTFDDILLLCAKYMSNAFDFKGKPAFLFVGTLLNHSCLPNVIFGERDGIMVFMTVKSISKGEEICDNYIDITMPKNERKKHLLEQYGFECNCERCTEKESYCYISDNKSIIIEQKRLSEFGYSKSHAVH
ncbi:SET domain-containing protein [Fadolivirus algeromassiliense]|jgi:SET domain-containing protein|uniref:SET domain-containing protein n=1 Tax=Fadolivirus FV1/VV64 TaxID=3070911 RepID=A0A7D3UTJ3_9VIRU|nr:SET domain-containing protein [Fadolivirus algeromassiliense]QKF93531.1 SET domain-containing protein [Fadolivirus FV1/VV64]